MTSIIKKRHGGFIYQNNIRGIWNVAKKSNYQAGYDVTSLSLQYCVCTSRYPAHDFLLHPLKPDDQPNGRAMIHLCYDYKIIPAL